MSLPDYPMGWVPAPAEVDAVLASMPQPTFATAAPHLAGSGKGTVALLYLAVRRVVGRDVIRKQTIGDCVSQGWATALDYLTAVQVVLEGRPEEWRGAQCSELLYGISRVNVGKGRIWGDGSVGAWAAKAVTDFGSLPYGADGVGFDSYDGTRAKQWGRSGPPANVLPKALDHRVQTATQITSYEQARDMLASGYPVPVASNQGFTTTRDKDGFASPHGSWGHEMCFVAVDDAGSRPGLLCQNSWGPDWISGPKRHDQPDGTFWVDADVATRMLKQEDSFAPANLAGFPNRDMSGFGWI